MESSIEHLELNEADSFAIYRLPQAKNVIFLQQKGQAKFLTKNNYFENGFVFHPFDKDKEKSYFIQAQISIKNPNWSFSIKRTNNSKSTTKVHYMEMINKAIEDIDEKMPKVVLSRIIKTRRSNKKIKRLFDEMCEKYENAFCYLVHIPSIGCWMGATPEKLVIESSKNIYSTMSLAGTHQINNIPQKWNAKEIEEQLIVTKYLRSSLSKLNLIYKEDELTTLRNGPVEHLCTHFEFRTNDINKAIEAIHPTPSSMRNAAR